MVNLTSTLRSKLSRYKREYLQSRVVADQRRRIDFAFIHIPKCGGTSVTQAMGQRIKLHDTARERRDKLGHDRWNAIYRFSFVRHPYERAVSFYSFHQKTAHGKSRVGDFDLNDWVRAALRDHTLSSTVWASRLAPCHTWLSDEKGQIIVDDVFKLEEIDQAWVTIGPKIGSSALLPHSNASRGGLTRDAFDATSRSILQDHFRTDFEAFGYIP